MIDIKIQKSGKTLSISAIGHADYAPYGSDIVCAGVSSVILGLCAALPKDTLRTEISSGQAFIRCSDTRDCRAYFRVVIKTLELIAAEYPENIKLVCNMSE